jgi:NMD protein affecting ribosome stability and mRNA decay
MHTKAARPGPQPVYRSKLIQERVHDAYKARSKPQEPTVCPECGAVFHKGRWQWLPRPEGAESAMCPACHRIHDRFPAGHVRLEGDFVSQHRADIVNLVRHVEQKARAEHPLQRIMEIVEEDGGLWVRTTDIHLAHGIGEALRHAYRGRLQSHYNLEENLLRVHWARQSSPKRRK